MNLSGISNRTMVGRALRAPLSLVPKETVVRILQSEIKGWRWLVGSSTHGCWLGSYELRKRKIFETHIPQGQVVYDIGANVGFYTLLASKLVGPSGHVYAFEPVPRNVAYLRKHLELNSVSNATIVESAVSDRSGTARFTCADNASMGSLSDSGSLSVRCSSLDDIICREKLRAPNILKIDVEGAESRVLEGARTMITNPRPTIFLATHGAHQHQACRKFLSAMQYAVSAIEPDEFLALPQKWA